MTRGKLLAEQGYKSTSNKYRYVARLPVGKTGIEACLALGGDAAAFARNTFANAEHAATAQYLRVYAPAEDKIELTKEEFDEFRRSGGGPV